MFFFNAERRRNACIRHTEALLYLPILLCDYANTLFCCLARAVSVAFLCPVTFLCPAAVSVTFLCLIAVSVTFLCLVAVSVTFLCLVAVSVTFLCRAAVSVIFLCRAAVSVTFLCLVAVSVTFLCRAAVSVVFCAVLPPPFTLFPSVVPTYSSFYLLSLTSALPFHPPSVSQVPSVHFSIPQSAFLYNFALFFLQCKITNVYGKTNKFLLNLIF